MHKKVLERQIFFLNTNILPCKYQGTCISFQRSHLGKLCLFCCSSLCVCPYLRDTHDPGHRIAFIHVSIYSIHQFEFWVVFKNCIIWSQRIRMCHPCKYTKVWICSSEAVPCLCYLSFLLRGSCPCWLLLWPSKQGHRKASYGGGGAVWCVPARASSPSSF